jgi:hypothetical protein
MNGVGRVFDFVNNHQFVFLSSFGIIDQLGFAFNHNERTISASSLFEKPQRASIFHERTWLL